jgi:putative SOS response-associated peptidase YedK
MCGRFVSASTSAELAQYFGAAPPGDGLPQNFNVAPTNDIYAVRHQGTTGGGGERSLEAFHWGLVPMWAKDTKVGNRMINARSETAAAKGAFKGPLARRRCLVPADGFFEWKVVGTTDKGKPKKQPMYIHRPDDEPLVMAGLWERWRGPDRDWDEALHSATLLTTSANSFMSEIHDRMPVFLAPGSWEIWLDPAVHDLDLLSKLLVPAPEHLLTAHAVDPMVGNVRNKGPELIAPYEPPAELTLY